MEVCIGIDAGTETLKLVMLVDHKIAYYQTLSLGSEAVPAVANSSLQQCLVATGMTARDVNFLGVAGVNAGEVPYSQEIVSEAICHPLGINWLYPDAHTLIDIGASKLIAFKCQKGKAVKMATGDKCASSVGATLRMVSNVLGISLEEMGRLFSRSDEPLTLQSTCSVFLETEIISLLHQKREKPEKILNGVLRGMSSKFYSLLLSLGGIEGNIYVTGGVARNSGIIGALENISRHRVIVPDNPEIIGAIGAALSAEAYR